jgi:putative ABC transport system permease protein
LFGAVAVFIVLIACINFINLSTAKAAGRAKEVGLRKTVGSHRSQIVRQFLVESLIFSVLSFATGILLAWALLPNFNLIAGKEITFPWMQTWFAPAMIVASIVVGLLAGAYPSFYLSSFRPAEVLKGNFARSGKNAVLRSGLVVFQFTASVVLVIATIVIYRQMDHLLNSNIGYEKDQVLVLNGTDILGPQINTFKDELLGLSTVKSATLSDYLPTEGTKRNNNGFRVVEEGNDGNTGAQFWLVDEDYAQTLGLKLVEGRFFQKDMASDSSAMVINRTMAKSLHLEHPIGTRIANNRRWHVIGVVEDFYFYKMTSEIEPLSMVLNRNANTISVKLNTSDVAGTMKAIEGVWQKFSPHQPIRAAFLDDTFAKMYGDVNRMGRIFTAFASFAIVVACLGLFALSAFMVEQRGKELSIRIVLGASVKSIFQLLTSSFVKLVLISTLLAVPIAWYLMDQWLLGFTVKTNIGVDVFLLAGGMAVLIALSTVSYQSIRAGLQKPIDNLRVD